MWQQLLTNGYRNIDVSGVRTLAEEAKRPTKKVPWSNLYHTISARFFYDQTFHLLYARKHWSHSEAAGKCVITLEKKWILCNSLQKDSVRLLCRSKPPTAAIFLILKVYSVLKTMDIGAVQLIFHCAFFYSRNLPAPPLYLLRWWEGALRAIEWAVAHWRAASSNGSTWRKSVKGRRSRRQVLDVTVGILFWIYKLHTENRNLKKLNQSGPREKIEWAVTENFGWATTDFIPND